MDRQTEAEVDFCTACPSRALGSAGAAPAALPPPWPSVSEAAPLHPAVPSRTAPRSHGAPVAKRARTAAPGPRCPSTYVRFMRSLRVPEPDLGHGARMLAFCCGTVLPAARRARRASLLRGSA